LVLARGGKRETIHCIYERIEKYIL
jgi:hypothetical protein